MRLREFPKRLTGGIFGLCFGCIYGSLALISSPGIFLIYFWWLTKALALNFYAVIKDLDSALKDALTNRYSYRFLKLLKFLFILLPFILLAGLVWGTLKNIGIYTFAAFKSFFIFVAQNLWCPFKGFLTGFRDGLRQALIWPFTKKEEHLDDFIVEEWVNDLPLVQMQAAVETAGRKNGELLAHIHSLQSVRLEDPDLQEALLLNPSIGAKYTCSISASPLHEINLPLTVEYLHNHKWFTLAFETAGFANMLYFDRNYSRLPERNGPPLTGPGLTWRKENREGNDVFIRNDNQIIIYKGIPKEAQTALEALVPKSTSPEAEAEDKAVNTQTASAMFQQPPATAAIQGTPAAQPQARVS